MKAKSKIFSIVIAVIVTILSITNVLFNDFPRLINNLVAYASDSATSGTCGSDLTWRFDNNTNTLTISGSGSMTNYGRGDGFFPSGSAFPWYNYKNDIKKVVIDSGVTSLEGYAFYDYDKLESVEMADTVKQIYEKTFYYCKNLEKISLSKSLRTLGKNAFEGCGRISKIVIPDGVAMIESSTFWNCENLSSISIPSSMKTIESYAFYNCARLEEVKIDNGLESLVAWAFEGCKALETIILPESVKELRGDVFNHCDHMRSVTFKNPKCNIGASFNKELTVIRGYTNSTAQIYAEKYGYKFESIGNSEMVTTVSTHNQSSTPTTTTTISPSNGSAVLGDANGDNIVNVRDAAYIAKMLAQGKASKLPKSADFNGDGKVNVRDAAAIAKFLATGKR